MEFDVVVVGGGLVGASLACALADTNLRIAVVEAVPLRSSEQPSYDDRTLALGARSLQVLSQVGVWDSLQSEGTPIRRVHVTSRGQFGRVILDASEQGLAAFGSVVEARLVGAALYARLAHADNVTLLCPARVTALNSDDRRAVVTVKQDDREVVIDTRLVVGADGAGSQVRELAGIAARTFDYRQTAVIANVTPDESHDGTAYERLTPNGPLAVLPQRGKRCGVVWVAQTAVAKGWLSCEDDEFLAGLQRGFGWRLGRIGKVGRRASYPLKRVEPERDIAQRVALIGNAAHTVHPVAAQGFNLGLRDVAALAHAVRDAADPGAGELLAEYSAARRSDHARVLRTTDAIVRLFGSELWPIELGRSVGLTALQMAPWLRHRLARTAMGFAPGAGASG